MEPNRPSLAPLVVVAAVAAGIPAIAGVLSCGTHTKGPSQVAVTAAPRPVAVDADSRVRIRFSHPLVEEAEVGKALDPLPFAVEPAVKAQARWEDRYTLALEFGEPLRRSTRYVVSLSGDLARRADQRTFAFVHQPLEVESYEGLDIEMAPPRPEITLGFNGRVKAADVVAHCAIHPAAGGAPVAVTLDETGADVADRVTVRSSAKLGPATNFVLRCENLPGEGGNVGLLEPYTLAFRTYPVFKVKDVKPADELVPADEVTLEIEFSTPVDSSTLGPALVTRPEAKALTRGWTDDDGRRYIVEAELEGGTEYTVEIPATVTDAFGQALGQATTVRFRTGDARARINMERGIFAVETAAPGYPVWSRNVTAYTVDCARIPKDRVVKLLTSEMDYDPWYDASEDDAIDWEELGVKAAHLERKVASEKNRWHVENLALHETCGGAAAGGAAGGAAAERRGLFLAEVRSDETKVDPDYRYAWRHPAQQRVLANVTDLGMLLKVGPASGLVWITSIQGGEPVAGARVSVYTPQGKKVADATTDARGLARLPGSAKLLKGAGAANAAAAGEEEGWNEFDSYRAQRLIVIAEKAGDLAVVDGNWANGIQIWNFGVPEDRRGGATRVRGLIQSDRGIYRPGETVHFKGLVREIAGGQTPRVPRGAPVAIAVEDSRGESVLDVKRDLTAYGGFAFDLPLAAEAPLGDYYVTATVQGQTFRERFQVEQFRKVEFELELGGAAAERNLVLGKQLDLSVKATYLFGSPVAGAEVTYNVERRRHAMRFPKHPEYVFEDFARAGYWEMLWSQEERPLDFVSDGSGKTDERGVFAFAVSDPSKDLTGPQDYLIQAVVTDATDQAVAKQAAVTAHRSDFYVGLHSQEFVQAVDMPFAVNTVAVTPDGKQVPASAKLSFLRQVSRCDTRGEYYTWRECKTDTEPVWARDVSIPATGNGTERIVPKEPGEYVVRLEAQDNRGNKVVASTFVWVIGKGEAFWSGDESARMSLVASKLEYQPGETARVVPRTSLAGGTALVTLERDGILDGFVTKLASSGEGIEIPLTAAHAPNVFASVAIVKGRGGQGDRHRPRFQMGVIDLKVAASAQRLQVAVETERPTYEPGQPVKGRVRVTQAGKPVRAEVSLSVADEGVLQLIAYKTPDPMAVFYSAWGLGIDAATTWNRIARIADPNSGAAPDEGGDSGPAAPSRVRSRFVNSAYWAASLVTDEKGEASFAFAAPDNLSAFRMMAVAADTGARFGSGDGRVTITQPLLVQPVLPRFFAEGDRAVVGLVVHNRSAAPGEITVAARATGAELTARGPLTVRLDAGGSTRVDFEAAVGTASEVAVEMTAAMGASRDDVRLTVPVNRPRVVEKTSLARGPIAGTLEVPVRWAPAAILPAESYLAISVDRTGMSELEGSLRYLIEYPYGCLEQTLSGFIPLVKVEDLAVSLDLEELRGPKLRAYIKAGAAKVVRHQHADGLFSLWPTGPTYPQLSAYALYGLLEAKRAGVEIDEDAVARGLGAVRKWANAANRKIGTGGEGATVAMTAYVLAANGKADAALNARLFEARRGLPVWGQAFLLRALKAARAPAAQVQTLKDEVLATLTMDRETALAHENARNQATFDDVHVYMSSDVRTSAIVLSALLDVGVEDAILAKLAEGLKRQQRPGGHWHNTQENIYGLVALADWARRRAAGSTKVTIALGGKPLASQTLRGNGVLQLTRPLAELEAGTLKIVTDGQALASVRLVTARRDPSAAAVAEGFTVTRQFLDVDTNRPIAAFRAGQLIRVRVEVTTPSERTYVALVDPLPAGLEPVNPAFATSQADREEAQPGWWWEPRTWTWIELRDDRVQAFSDRMRAGTHKVEYLVRATLAGTFAAAPTTVEAMYSPDVRGRTTPHSLTIVR